MELAVGVAKACYEAKGAAAEHACAEDVQLPERWQLRQTGQEQPATAKRAVNKAALRQRHGWSIPV